MNRRVGYILLGVLALAVVAAALLWSDDKKPSTSADIPSERDAAPALEPDTPVIAPVRLEFPPLEVAESRHAVRFVMPEDTRSEAISAVVGAPGMWPPASKQVAPGVRVALPEPEAATFAGESVLTYEIYAHSGERDHAYWSDVSVEESSARKVELRAASPLEVRVTDGKGAAVADSEVRLARGLIGLVHLTRQTNADGRATFDAIPEGDYRLTVQAPGFVRRSRLLLHTDAGRVTDMQLDRGASVAGRVVDASGAALADATVEIIPVSPFAEETFDAEFLSQVGVASQVTTTDGRGDFRVGGIEVGAVRVHASAEGFASGLSDVVRMGRGGHEDIGEIVLREQDPGRAGLGDLTVRLEELPAGVSPSALELSGQAEHGPQRCMGRRLRDQDWRFTRCAKGRMTLRAFTDDYGTAATTADFAETTTVSMPGLRGVEVRFEGLRGPQWDGSGLRWRQEGGDWVDAAFGDARSFDSRVWRHTLFPGDYQVEFDNPLTGPVRRSLAVGAADASLTVDLSPLHSVELFVVDATGTPVTGALVQIWQGGRKIAEATSAGRSAVSVELPTPFDGTVVAFDGRRGEGRSPLAVPEAARAATEAVVRLDQPLFSLELPPGRVTDLAQIERVLEAELVRDGRAWLIDAAPNSPVVEAGVERGDRLVWLRKTGSGWQVLVERGGSRLEVEF